MVTIGLEDAKPSEYRLFHEKPMSAEQLMWSMITATGHQHIPDTTDTSISQTDDEQDQLPLGLDDIRSRFSVSFANPPREPETEFAPSVRGALFVLNGPRVLDWLESRPDNLTAKLETLETGFATPLYLAVLSPKTNSRRGWTRTNTLSHNPTNLQRLNRLSGHC